MPPFTETSKCINNITDVTVNDPRRARIFAPWRRVLQEIVATHGRLDGAFNNVALAKNRTMGETDRETCWRVFETG